MGGVERASDFTIARRRSSICDIVFTRSSGVLDRFGRRYGSIVAMNGEGGGRARATLDPGDLFLQQR
jgi:hypothetical protein